MDKTDCYFYYKADKDSPSDCTNSANYDWPADKKLPCKDCVFYITKEKAKKIIEAFIEAKQVGCCDNCVHYKICTKAKAGTICRIKYPER